MRRISSGLLSKFYYPQKYLIGIVIYSFFSVQDEKNQVMTTNIWLDQEWKDEMMQWDPKEFNGITKLQIPCDKLWLPDIVLYNRLA